MSFIPTFDDVSPAIRGALEGHGFTSFTPVQEAVLDPALAGRDLRIFSQTGSGKTVAVGLAIAPALEEAAAKALEAGIDGSARPGAKPFALVIAPTRELAQQIGRELHWLFAPIRAGVATVTGGASYVRELAAMKRCPLVVVGTPGRLLDHLNRKSLNPANLGVVVLDEADQMLDLGFKDELDAILTQTPETRRTLLLSATFPREVQRLADRCQRDPVVAAGAGAGERNTDITHVAHLVLFEEREKALVNLLLMAPGERALVFVRTREGAADLADRLSDLGLPARAIHGDLEQRDRTRTLDAFRSGAVATLVATDVAARGLDVPDVARVIHADPPNDAEVFTHRSGRTGRAGKKGISVVLVPPQMRERVRAMLRRAGIEAAWSPAPSASEVLAAADARLVADLLGEDTEAKALPLGETPKPPPQAPPPRLLKVADQLLAAKEAREIVAALLARVARAGSCEPAEVTPIHPPSPRVAQTGPPPPRRGRRLDGEPGRGFANPSGGRDWEPGRAAGPRDRAPERGDRSAPDGSSDRGFVPFRINWGENHGADPRRVLALVCRRGDIRGADVGAIRVGSIASTFEVASHVAAGFAQAVREPDTRDPRIHITPVTQPTQAGGAREEGRSPPRRPYVRTRDPEETRPPRPAPRAEDEPSTEEPKPRPEPRAHDAGARPTKPHSRPYDKPRAFAPKGGPRDAKKEGPPKRRPK